MDRIELADQIADNTFRAYTKPVEDGDTVMPVIFGSHTAECAHPLLDCRTLKEEIWSQYDYRLMSWAIVYGIAHRANLNAVSFITEVSSMSMDVEEVRSLGFTPDELMESPHLPDVIAEHPDLITHRLAILLVVDVRGEQPGLRYYTAPIGDGILGEYVDMTDRNTETDDAQSLARYHSAWRKLQ